VCGGGEEAKNGKSETQSSVGGKEKGGIRHNFTREAMCLGDSALRVGVGSTYKIPIKERKRKKKERKKKCKRAN